MAKLSIIYFPERGKPNSPVDVLLALCSDNDKTHLIAKLEMLCEVGMGCWNQKWLEYFDGIYQVRQGDFRLYFGIIGNQIVVSHLCRKTSQTAKTEDLSRARLNLQGYRGK